MGIQVVVLLSALVFLGVILLSVLLRQVSRGKPFEPPTRQVRRRWKDEGIIAAPRQGWVRVSPHFYVAPEEISAAMAVLDE